MSKYVTLVVSLVMVALGAFVPQLQQLIAENPTLAAIVAGIVTIVNALAPSILPPSNPSK